jgi:hypothetical protein
MSEELTKDLEICKLHAKLQEQLFLIQKLRLENQTITQKLNLEKKETKFFIVFSAFTWALLPILIALGGK